METAPNHKIKNLKDIETIEKKPLQDYLSANNTYELLKHSASKYMGKTALRFLADPERNNDISYSYREMFELITQAANSFYALGVNQERSVAMLLPNIPQAHFTLWGGEAAGIVTPINQFLDAEHIAAIMREADSRVLVTLAPSKDYDLWEKAKLIASQVPTLVAILTVDIDKLSSQDLRSKNIEPTVEESCKVIDFDQYLTQFNNEKLDSGRVIHPGDIAAYFHTGGTTGVPKLAQHSHYNEVAASSQAAFSLDYKASDVGICGLPLFHVNGAIVTGLAAFHSGVEIILLTADGFRNPRALSQMWQVVERHKASFFSAVPTVISGLLNFDTHGHDLSSLKVALCGAAPLPKETKQRFEKATGLVIVEGYGQTEGTCATAINPMYGEHRNGSVGLRLPFMQIKTVILNENSRTRRDCAVNEVGIIAISGPTVICGYKQESKNADLWVEDGWLNSGDLGRIDEDGYLWLTGRSKDVIIRGGHNIDPIIIEEVLYQHSAIAEAAAVGRPDIKSGEVPVAYIQLTPSGVATTDQILLWAAEHISERAAVPKEIYIVDEIPTTAVGKIFKPDLRADQIKRCCEQELEHLGINAKIEIINCSKLGQLAEITINRLFNEKRPYLEDKLEQYNFAYKIL